MSERVAVISGGGAFGMKTVSELRERNLEYDFVVGCSTGALMAPLVALGKYERLFEAYSGVTQEDIFNVNPFNSDGKLKLSMVFKRLLKMLGSKTPILNKFIDPVTSIGETKNLRDRITDFYTFEDHLEIIKTDKKVYVVVQDVSSEKGNIKYVGAHECSYETFCDYIWASTAVPFVCATVEIDDVEYLDGGVTEVIPLQYALANSSGTVDCYIHRILPDEGDRKIKSVRDMLHLAVRLYLIQRRDIEMNDLAFSEIIGKDRKINLSYLPHKLGNNSMMFSPDIMSVYAEVGKNYAKNNKFAI